jgi:BirA family biotin operon repressor/biotin-[acetyl-CoA-carboxylase] ligase
MNSNSVLDFLRKNREIFVSGEEISRKLGVSRSAVWKEIESLRNLSYEIQAQPHLGYRLESVPDKMFADEISFGLDTRVIGRPIFSYEELDSTNDAVFKLGQQGIKEGACVFAEHQKKGRGRLGRTWVSPKGKNIILSILLRPLMAPTEASKITLTAAVSVIKTIRNITGKKLGIKWPNDIFYGDKKAGGILTEMSAETDRLNFVVLGLGINVNSSFRELPQGSISLKEIEKAPVSRLEFSRQLLKNLDLDYACLKAGQFEKLAKEWEDFSVTSGKRVMALAQGKKIEGLATGIDAEGALWIRQDNGFQQKIIAGDIQHLR